MQATGASHHIDALAARIIVSLAKWRIMCNEKRHVKRACLSSGAGGFRNEIIDE